ncbi:MAG: PD40 domain-containing protein, partial [Acidobacteria bacterium]|nr:PD40 domain-containing protein [Acidobacteriota bacterium]
MNADGTGQQRLTFGADGVTDEQPVWSRDGSRIAFVSTRDGDKEVYVMNADGTGQTRLTNDPGNAFDESVEFNNIVATLTASGAPSSAASSLATARVDLFNQPGDQIRARDCEWGVSLLSLPGRAGLDLGLGLSYSSLVWTRSGPYAYFDEDRGSPSPGFQLGFATIRGPYFDAQAARNVYVLVTSSGRRVSLRQVGTSDTYEAADSSYLQLTAGGGGLLLRSTDGTQVSYSASNNGWRATLIEDRNG